MSSEIKKTTEKICESCEESFSCGAETDECWCFKVKVTNEILESLQQNFKNCLCPDCLRNYDKENQIFERL